MEINTTIALLVMSALGVVAVLGWRLISVVRSIASGDNRIVYGCLRQMRISTNRITRRLASSYEDQLRAARDHYERLVELKAASPSQLSEVVPLHVSERNAADERANIRATNDQTAETQEAVMIEEASELGKNRGETPPRRVEVPRDAASLARERINRGKIPQRHT